MLEVDIDPDQITVEGDGITIDLPDFSFDGDMTELHIVFTEHEHIRGRTPAIVTGQQIGGSSSIGTQLSGEDPRHGGPHTGGRLLLGRVRRLDPRWHVHVRAGCIHRAQRKNVHIRSGSRRGTARHADRWFGFIVPRRPLVVRLPTAGGELHERRIDHIRWGV